MEVEVKREEIARKLSAENIEKQTANMVCFSDIKKAENLLQRQDYVKGKHVEF